MLSTTQGAAVPSVVFKSFVLNALGRSLQPVWKYFFVQYAFCRHILVQRCALQRQFQFRGREGTTTHQGCTSGWAYQLLRGSALFWLTPPYFSRPSPSDPFSLARPCASDTALDQTCYDGGWDWSRRNTESYDPRAGANQRF